MGSKGVLSSAAAGVSLVVASVVLVIGVSALIGFRGFDSARSISDEQSVVLDGQNDAREAGATASPAAAVIGSGARPAARRPAARRSSARPARRKAVRRTKRKAAVRIGRSAPARRRQAPVAQAAPQPGPASAPRGETAPETSGKDAPTASAAPLQDAVEDAVEDVTGAVGAATEEPAKTVGDVLLDLRDVLP